MKLILTKLSFYYLAMKKEEVIRSNSRPGIIQTYSKIDIVPPYIMTPVYEDPEKHILLT